MATRCPGRRAHGSRSSCPRGGPSSRPSLLDAALDGRAVRVDATEHGARVRRRSAAITSPECTIDGGQWIEWLLSRIHAVNDNTFEIDRAGFVLYQMSLGDLYPDFDAAGPGEKLALRLGERNRALYEALGLRDGDVVRRVAGIDVGWGAAQEMLRAVGQASTFKVELSRAGRARTLSYRVRD